MTDRQYKLISEQLFRIETSLEKLIAVLAPKYLSSTQYGNAEWADEAKNTLGIQSSGQVGCKTPEGKLIAEVEAK